MNFESNIKLSTIGQAEKIASQIFHRLYTAQTNLQKPFVDNLKLKLPYFDPNYRAKSPGNLTLRAAEIIGEKGQKVNATAILSHLSILPLYDPFQSK